MPVIQVPQFWERQQPEPPPLPEEIEVDIAGDGAQPRLDPSTGYLEIAHPDGSVTIDLKPDLGGGDEAEADHFENLAEKIDDAELSRISEELLQGIEADDQSRQEWLAMRARGIDLLGLKLEEPRGDIGGSSAPLEGMSTVRHPLLLEAVLRFQANARGELLPSEGPVKVRNDGRQDFASDYQAEALEDDLNHYLTTVATEYYPDTDRMLFMVGFGGMMFKKVYNCPLRRRPVSESVDAKDLIVSNTATDLDNCARITHVINMRPAILRRMQLIGEYRDVALLPPQPEPNKVDEKIARSQGVDIKPRRPEDADHVIYECHCELDIAGFEHRDEDGNITGLPLPYVVVIDKTSRTILQIRRNWRPDDDDFKKIKTFVPYPFVPGLGFYAIGLLNILGNTASAVTAAWRELLDAGMFANFPGFLYLKNGSRQLTNQFRIPPGGGAAVDGDPSSDIRKQIMPLPYKPPDTAFVQFVDNIAQTGQRVGGTAEIEVGEGRQDAPVGTTLALIEQATKIMDAVHKRLHAAQAEEFRLLRERFKEDPEALWRYAKGKKPWNEQIIRQALENFDLIPVADPNTPSHMHRIMKAIAIKQLQAANPALYDAKTVDERILRMMKVDDPDSLFAPPQPPMAAPGPDPVKLADIDVKRQANQVKLAELAAKMKDAEKERRSNENLELLKLAQTLAIHPEAEQLVKRTVKDRKLAS